MFINCRVVLLSVSWSLFPFPIFGQDVGWLPEIQIDSIQNASSKLTPKPLPAIPNRDAALRSQAQLLKKWSEYIGVFPLPTDRKPPVVELLEHVDIDDTIYRDRIRYETEPGQQVEAYVMGPSNKAISRPGVVVFHSTVQHSILQCVGLADPSKGGAPSPDELRKAFGLFLAKMGFVTLSPRNYLWTDNLHLNASAEASAFLQRNPGRLGMSRMLLDAILAVDLLSSFDGVDPTRIGAIGHSLGAKEVLYLAAFDPRVKASVSSEGGVGIAQTNWEAPWYLGPSCKDPSFTMDHHELLACIAPRPFLLVGGNASDGIESVPFMREANTYYKAMGGTNRLGLLNHAKGHAVTEESLEKSLEWLRVYLETKK